MERTHQEFMSCEERLKIAGGGKAGGPLSQFEREVSCFELSSPQTALSLSSSFVPLCGFPRSRAITPPPPPRTSAELMNH